MQDIMQRASQLARLEIYSGVSTAVSLESISERERAFLMRVFRDGSKTCERVSSEWIGQVVIANMHIDEPDVARAKLIVIPMG